MRPLDRQTLRFAIADEMSRTLDQITERNGMFIATISVEAHLDALADWLIDAHGPAAAYEALQAAADRACDRIAEATVAASAREGRAAG